MTDRGHFVSLAMSLGWQDVRDTYKRSTLGPLWITLGLAIQVAAIGIVFGLLFGADLTVFFPFLATSLILWNFLVSSITESTGAYVQSQQIVKQMYVPSYFPVIRVLAKNFITLLHNSAIIVVILFVFGNGLGVSAFALLPGLAVVAGVIFAVSLVAATVSARFRDVPPIIGSILMVSFYVTPVIWMPESLPESFRNIVLTYNPLYHLLELMRSPLLGQVPTLLNWLVSLGVLAVLSLLAYWVAKKYSWRIVFWL